MNISTSILVEIDQYIYIFTFKSTKVGLQRNIYIYT